MEREFGSKSIAELRTIAKNLGVPRYSTYKAADRSELISKIENAQTVIKSLHTPAAPGSESSDTSVDSLVGKPVSELKTIAKNLGVPRYSTYKAADKHALISEISKRIGSTPVANEGGEQEDADFMNKGMSELKTIAKRLGVPRYSTYNTSNKESLISQITSRMADMRITEPRRVEMIPIPEIVDENIIIEPGVSSLGEEEPARDDINTVEKTAVKTAEKKTKAKYIYDVLNELQENPKSVYLRNINTQVLKLIGAYA